MDATDATWFQCDVHSLRILKAITLDALGKVKEALAVIFTETMLPPAEESSVVMRVQAALCALHIGNNEKAKEHGRVALQTHNLLFGGGVAHRNRSDSSSASSQSARHLCFQVQGSRQSMRPTLSLFA
jgi:hypothetical protein